MAKNSKGLAHIALILIIGVAAGLSLVSYLVYRHNKSLPSCSGSQVLNASKICVEPASSFLACTSQPGSKLLESYPEVCVDANGKRFVNSSQSAVPETFRGKVSAIINNCAADGFCTIFIDGRSKSVITGGGRYASTADNVWGKADANIKEGDTVEVKALSIGAGSFTLQRCAACCVRTVR